MFAAEDILYEDNHLMVVNKHAGDLVQPDPSGASALENEIKAFIKQRDSKPGDVFLGVAHRIDRPVSGAVVFAKTSKALVRLNEIIKNRELDKRYWAIVEQLPSPTQGELVHYIVRDPKTNRSRALDKAIEQAKQGVLRYRLLASGDRYHLVEVELITGRHHQIRAQLSRIGCSIKGDLKYGAARSNLGGGISLHARSLSFTHPVTKQPFVVVAPTPKEDKLWSFFEKNS